MSPAAWKNVLSRHGPSLRALQSPMSSSFAPSSLTSSSSTALRGSIHPIRRHASIASFVKGPSIDALPSKDAADLPQLTNDLRFVQDMVRSYDPSGTLPGRLLPTNQMQLVYYAVRSFWVETGLRKDAAITRSPTEQLDWWQEGIQSVYDKDHEQSSPTLRLLSHLVNDHQIPLTQCHFDDILKSRRNDLDLTQYPDMEALNQHAIWSCGSLFQLVLESNDARHHCEIANTLGVCHGLTNALRTSIPVLSTTGKLILPQDLCEKYGVSSPRYLLSALGMGDATCQRAMRNVVADIVAVARQHLKEGRDALAQHNDAALNSVFLPILASETFLDRLEEHAYDLTDRNLRNVSTVEHWQCAMKMAKSAYQNQI